MPFGAIKLIPGVNVERTPTLLETGYSQSALGRFKDGLFQKLGGWQLFYPFNVAGVPRALHAWQALDSVDRLAVGTTTQLDVITNSQLSDITPQTFLSNFAPKFTTIIGSNLVEITDANISNVTTLDAVFFNTPISVGGVILSGAYPINIITGTHTYKIAAAMNATANITNGGAVPVFDTIINSATIKVTFADYVLTAAVSHAVFPIPTTGGGTTINGGYLVNSTPTTSTFNITIASQATSTATFSMNSGNAQLLYYINLGPPATGVGFGIGGFGVGGFGSGVVPSEQTGTEIITADWTEDNWGEILLACPKNGGVYYWRPNSGQVNAYFISTAPAFNGGIFVAMPEQILVCWGSTVNEDLGVQQDPLFVYWSESGDFTNFIVSVTTQAGSFRIPTGSTIKGGLQGPQQALIWTDIDLWAMSYLGPPLVFGFNKVSGGSGLVSAHAAVQFNGSVYWMDKSNFYVFNSGGAQVLPCSVWDAVFQNLNTVYLDKCWAWVNTPFNEIWFYYPSAASTGQCDSYAKINVLEGSWDYGSLARSCGIAQTVFGPPIAATPTSIIYQHELTNDAAGQPINSVMQTGYFVIGDGENIAFVDWMLPDFKFGQYSQTQSANISITLYVTNYPGDIPTVYGPFNVTSTTEYISPRARGRQMAVRIESSDLGSFWRLGNIRYRWARDGRL